MDKKYFTVDRNAPQYAAKYFTVGKLGPNREITPEGFLICKNCGIARTGMMEYGANELPLDPGPDGIVQVTRGEEDVFRPETLASLIGKSVIDNHPDLNRFPEGNVTARNWKDMEIGVVLDVRRGEGADQDLIIADLLIKEPSAIDLIQSGKVELSAGYDAAYEQTGPGTARQYNIVYNHVALVDAGRCGPRCSIGDALPPLITARKVRKMKFDRRTMDKIRKAFKTNDEEALEEALSSDSTEGRIEKLEDCVKGMGDNLAKLSDSVTKMSDAMRARDEDKEEKKSEDRKARDEDKEEEKKSEDRKARDEDKEDEKKSEDKARDEDKEDDKEEKKAKTGDNIRAKDSRELRDEYQEVRATAEIIVPGFTAPTFDAAADAKVTLDSLCAFRRNVLKRGSLDGTAAAVIRGVIGNRHFDFDKESCARVADVFNVVGSTIAAKNNEVAMSSFPVVPGANGGLGLYGAVKSPADINKMNQDFYK